MTLTAHDIDRHFKNVAPYNDWSTTCDTFKAGDPEREIHAIAVAWISSLQNLHRAHKLGCDMFITHEPTFYSHMDDDPAFDQDDCTIEKRAFLEETGMVIYRCHDVWDRFPVEGILDSWAACLDLTQEPTASDTFWRVVPIEPTSVADFARRTARQLQHFSQEAILTVGDPERQIRSVAIGTGAISNLREYRRLGADAAIITEVTWWRDISWAKDSELAVFVVDHTVSEEPGMMNLAAYLGREFQKARIEYIPTHCPYEVITAKG